MSVEDIILTICIPTYNRRDYLESLLESLTSEIVDGIQIVISDNASTDGTEYLVERFVKQGMPIKYKKWEVNKGPDCNFLACVELADGEYCWFVGSDDVVVDGSVSRLITEIKNVRADVFIINKIGYNKDFTRRKITFNPMGDVGDVEVTIANENKVLSGLASNFGYIGVVCVRKSLWIAVDCHAYIGTAYVHVYILQKLLSENRRFKYIDSPFIKWRFDNDSILMESKALGRLNIELNYIRITESVFGKCKLTNSVADIIAKNNIFYQIITYKLMTAYTQEMLALLYNCLRYRPIFYYLLLPVCLLPSGLVIFIRSIYRRSLKPFREKRLV